MPKVLFTELQLSSEVLKSIEEMGFESSTAIQGEAIPPILAGRDLIGQSSTGTGKTIAFAVPAVEKVDTHLAAVQVLTLCPTRELCIQVAEQMAQIGKYKKNLHTLPIYGGAPYDRQIDGLRRGAQIVIGTPGRLIDHLERGTLKLDKVKLIVLDEADEMLDMGFQEDLDRILERVPKEKQTVLFSATMQPGIRRLAARYLKDPLMVQNIHEAMTVPTTAQAYFEVRGSDKLEALTRVLDFHKVKLGIIFCNTRLGVDDLVSHLQARGYSAEGLHGEHKQNVRDRIMKKFRSGHVELLVATDVASRGIDVKDVAMVFNYDLPKDEEDYVHRIGRTGRAGKSGLALSFASGRDISRLRNIERFTKQQIIRQSVPTLLEVESAQYAVVLDKVRETLSQGGLEKFSAMLKSLTGEETTVSDVACALLKMVIPAAPKREVVDFESQSYAPGRSQTQYDSRSGHPGNSGRAERKPRGGYAVQGPATTITINIGKAKGAMPKDIVGALTGETGLPGKTFGNIDMFPNHTTVEVPKDKLDEIIGSFQNVRIKGIKVFAKKF